MHDTSWRQCIIYASKQLRDLLDEYATKHQARVKSLKVTEAEASRGEGANRMLGLVHNSVNQNLSVRPQMDIPVAK